MNRREFLGRSVGALLGGIGSMTEGKAANMTHRTQAMAGEPQPIILFLCGDVMTGRGIDQILPHPGQPHLYEGYIRSAVGYVELAEAQSGPIRRPVDFSYIWGDALAEFRRTEAGLRIVNLETAVTASEDAWPAKGIHYRMHPANVPCLTAAGIDCCVLANNHVLDWGYAGLRETIDALRGAGIATAGAGRDAAEAAAPAVLQAPGKGRVLVYAWGMESSGVPREWAAGEKRPGVNFLDDLSAHNLEAIARRIDADRRPGDRVVASIHWGANWGYAVTPAQRDFAHGLVDLAGVDVVHGHSSHHVKGIEVWHNRLVLYGCGDFLNDYEGIGGYEAYRGDLSLMYFPALDAADGRLLRLDIVPTRTRRMRVSRAAEADTRWLMATLNREGAGFGTRVERLPEGELLLRW